MPVCAAHENLFHWNNDLNLWLKKTLQWGADYQEGQNILLLEKLSPGFLKFIWWWYWLSGLFGWMQAIPAVSDTGEKAAMYFIIQKKSLREVWVNVW